MPWDAVASKPGESSAMFNDTSPTYTFLELKKNLPYLIYNVKYYTAITKVNRTSDINKKYQSFEIDLYDGDIIIDDDNLLYNDNIIDEISNYTTEIDSDNNIKKIISDNIPIQTITPNISFSVNNNPNYTLPNNINNIINISNVKKEKININSINIFKPYKPVDNSPTENNYLIQNNYIQKIEVASYVDKDDDDVDINILFGFKVEFQYDTILTPTFDIRDYINNGIILRYVSEKFDISNNNNKQFIVLYEDEDIPKLNSKGQLTNLELIGDEKKYIIYIRYSKWDWVDFKNDIYLASEESKYTTLNDNGFWQPANSIWLQIKINIHGKWIYNRYK